MEADSTGRFAADEAGTVVESEFIATGVRSTSDGQYLMFQRSLPIGADDDWGIHVEFNDQINASYDAIKSCEISRRQLRVELFRAIGRGGRWKAFVIELNLSREVWDDFVANLRRVFAGREELLSVL